jgi:hypothetical protein
LSTRWNSENIASICSQIQQLLVLWFLVAVLADWFLSSSDPYPYFASIWITLSALVLCVCSFAAEPLTSAMVALQPFKTEAANSSPFTRAKRQLFHISNIVTFCLAFSLAILAMYRLSALDAFKALLSAPIGTGLGTAILAPVAQAANGILVQEWGAILVLITTAIVTLGAVLGAIAIICPTNNARGRAALAAVALASLFCVFLCPQGSAPFLTTDTILQTWIFVLSIAALNIAASPGRASGQTVNKPPVRISRGAVIVFLATAALVAAFILFVGNRARVRVAIVSAIKMRSPGYLHLDLISEPMQDATVAMEDGHFYQHHGFDFAAMHRALRVDIREGRIAQGGSTITQQLAKNLFLTQDRTIWRKLQEAVYTIALEHELTKQQILELYFNTIDYGMGNHGIRQASAYYFHTTPDKLTLAQSATLVGLVPEPPRRLPALAADREPEYENLDDLSLGEQTALGRIAYFFPERYSSARIAEAQSVSLEKLIYPYKDAWDRGATDTLPAIWHGISFYYYADPNTPADVNHVSPCLEPELAGFIDQARKKYQLVGIEHLGVYDDRTMRQSETVTSAHAFGQAIDISGFKFGNGTEINVRDHDNPSVLAKLLTIEALLKKHFDIVVDWRNEPVFHQTHFHCEVRGPRVDAPNRASTTVVNG